MSIPKIIQELVFGKACAQNFDQAKPVQKCPPIRNRGRFCRSKLWDAGDAKSRFLNYFRYKSATQKRIQTWLEGPYDDETKGELRRLLKEDPKSLFDAFFKDLSFGTGGLRGLMGIGSNRLNLYTIRTATQGLANYLKQREGVSIFIGYDVRRNSAEFALEAARVLAGNGIRALLTSEICPTPLVSFACRHYGCQAGIMITASHNPPQYNGYKVYWSDGAQIVPPHDSAIIAEVEKITDPAQVNIVEPDSELIQLIGKELDDAYLKELKKLRLFSTPLRVLYTPLHGTGIRIIPEALQSWGFSCHLVERQKTPDGNFPEAPSPNPEEEAALHLGCEQLVREQRDLLIATDPDADRVGVAVLHEGKAMRLTGHQIACLCLSHICERGPLPKNGAFIKTIVTTELFAKIAAGANRPCVDVLTGFKYIAEQIGLWERAKDKQYIFGGEESYGYLFGTFVRDKDAISSSCLIAEAAALAKREHLTLIDRLHQLYRRYGVHRESLVNVAFPDSQAGMEAISRLMKKLRGSPPDRIGSLRVSRLEDYLGGLGNLPRSDVLRFWLEDGSKLVIRPSGTESKVKIYAEVVQKPGPDLHHSIEECDIKLHSLVHAFRTLCGV